jgi:hypothetical protein
MTGTESERALRRLEQLAREERAAVLAQDVEALCRISALVPDATTDVLKGQYSHNDRFDARVSEVLAAHSAAETFLNNRLEETRDALRLLSGAQRAATGYGRAGGHASRIQSQG